MKQLLTKLLNRLNGTANNVIELRPGGTYIVECPTSLTREEAQVLSAHLAAQTAGKNIDFLVLDSGIKIAR